MIVCTAGSYSLCTGQDMTYIGFELPIFWQHSFWDSTIVVSSCSMFSLVSIDICGRRGYHIACIDQDSWVSQSGVSKSSSILWSLVFEIESAPLLQSVEELFTKQLSMHSQDPMVEMFLFRAQHALWTISSAWDQMWTVCQVEVYSMDVSVRCRLLKIETLF